jgi:two-component system cell cycle response regulator
LSRVCPILPSSHAESGFVAKSAPGVTVSIGIASGTTASRIDSLTLDAHRCLTAAKAHGRNRVVAWNDLRRQADELDIPISLLQMEDETRVVLEEIADRVAFKARALYRQYSEQARIDPLTGLVNRGGFDSRMQREFENAHKHGTLLTIGMIDVDDFGALNKQYSLVTGDAALRIMGDVLTSTVRSVDWVARYGGEEFCVVMPNTTVAEGEEVMERIRVAVAQHPIPTDDGRTIRITISAGVAQLMESDRDVEDFISRASRQTNVAKRSGKNQISAYH